MFLNTQILSRLKLFGKIFFHALMAFNGAKSLAKYFIIIFYSHIYKYILYIIWSVF